MKHGESALEFLYIPVEGGNQGLLPIPYLSPFGSSNGMYKYFERADYFQ
jgi:hypothetical protein